MLETSCVSVVARRVDRTPSSELYTRSALFFFLESSISSKLATVRRGENRNAERKTRRARRGQSISKSTRETKFEGTARELCVTTRSSTGVSNGMLFYRVLFLSSFLLLCRSCGTSLFEGGLSAECRLRPELAFGQIFALCDSPEGN